ncbi:MAG: hypothetical protein WKF30_12380 [Pyrinomonadaceae bacterium]
MSERIQALLRCRKREFAGYDPFDALKTASFKRRPYVARAPCVFLTQALSARQLICALARVPSRKT